MRRTTRPVCGAASRRWADLVRTPVGELAYADVRDVDVGSWMGPQFSSERPPLFEETLGEEAARSLARSQSSTTSSLRTEIAAELAAAAEASGSTSKRARWAEKDAAVGEGVAQFAKTRGSPCPGSY